MATKVLFDEIRGQITEALNARFRAPGSTKFTGESGFTLLDGFIMQPLQKELPGVIIGGPAIPLVAVLGNTSGTMYYFPLKILLPNLEI